MSCLFFRSPGSQIAVLTLLFSLLMAVPTAWASRVTVDAEGRTLSLDYSGITNEAVVEILGVPPSERLKYQLRFKPVAGPVKVFPLDMDAAQAHPDSEMGLRFRVPLEGSNFFVYNLWYQEQAIELSDSKCQELIQRSDNAEVRIEELDKQIRDLPISKEIAELEQLITEGKCPKQDQIDEIEDATAQLNARLEDLAFQIATYKELPVDPSVARIQKLYLEIDELKKKKDELTTRKEILKKECEAQLENLGQLLLEKKKVRNELPDWREKQDLKLEKNSYDDKWGTKCQEIFKVKKLGFLFSGKQQKPVHYGFTETQDRNAPYSLNQLGTYPVFTNSDSLYVVIANTRHDLHPRAFKLTVEAESGSPINIEEVRPSFDEVQDSRALALADRGTKRIFKSVDSAYRDLVLPIDRSFKAWDKPKVTVALFAKVVTEDSETTTTGGQKPDTTTKTVKELKEIKLLDQVEYPQIHGLYRYNFAAGIAVSDLRDPDFVKVKVEADDPDTPDENEDRYQIVELEGSRDIVPLFSFTVYWKKLDIVKPVTWTEAIIPNPTISFSMSDPTEDLFLGFSHSILRNVQLLWGVHTGMIKELKPRNDIDEETDSTAPETREVRDEAYFVGLAFNLKVITRLFKKS